MVAGDASSAYDWILLRVDCELLEGLADVLALDDEDVKLTMVVDVHVNESFKARNRQRHTLKQVDNKVNTTRVHARALLDK